MVYVQAIIAAFSFGREYLKYLSNKEASKAKRKESVKKFREKLKEKDSHAIEKMFTDLEL